MTISKRSNGESAVVHQGSALAKALIRQAVSPMALIAADGTLVEVSSALAELLSQSPDHTPDRLLGTRFSQVLHPADKPQLQSVLGDLRSARRDSITWETRLVVGKGQPSQVRATLAAIHPSLDDIFVLQLSGTGNHQSGAGWGREPFRLLAETAADVLCSIDRDGQLSWVSPSVERTLGWMPEKLLGMPLVELIHADDRDRFHAVHNQISTDQSSTAQLRVLSTGGDPRWMNLSLCAVHSQEGAWDGAVAAWRDVQQEVEIRQQLERALTTDHLTGLQNRSAMAERLSSTACVAVLQVGIDRLAEVNHALGHRAGDHLLERVATRLVEVLGSEEAIGRGAGDAFIIQISDPSSRERLQQHIEQLRDHCKGQVVFDDHVIDVSISIGVALWSPERSTDQLLHDAFLAMREAARQGQNRIAFADPEIGLRAKRSLAMQVQLREAIQNKELQAWFMPLVDLASGDIQGFEALVRWHRPDGTVAPPDSFLPIARKSQLATDIDLLVLHQAVEALTQLPEAISIAANLTPTTLGKPGLAKVVGELLQSHGVTPSRLHLEITETALLDRGPEIDSTIQELAALGIRWMLDDFGTGYSSISNLRDLPIHGLKLDRSFTAAIRQGDQKSVRLAQALAGLGDGLGLILVAEGIESTDEAAVLQDLGWHLGQGWLYGKPAPFQHWAQLSIQSPQSQPPAPSLARNSWALAVTDNVPVGLFAFRAGFEEAIDLLFVSKRCCDLLRVEREEISQGPATILSRIDADDREVLLALWSKHSPAGTPFDWVGRTSNAQETTWIRLECIPVPQVDGTVVWQGVMSDVTTQKNQEIYLRRILNEAPIPIAIQELDGDDPKINFVNRQFETCFGYSQADIPTLSEWATLAYPDTSTRESVFAEWNPSVHRARIATGVVDELEAQVIDADGHAHEVLFSAVVIGNEMVISVIDLTPWRRTERELSAARSALAETALAITEAIPVGTYTMVQPKEGGMGYFSFMSDRFLKICGLEREAAAADPLQAFACVHPDDYEAWVELNAKTFAEKLPFYGECRVVADGQIRWISAESVPRDLPDGSTVWEGVLIDISAQKEALEQVQKERSLLNTILEHINAHVYMKDRQGRYLYVNPHVCDLLGRPQSDIIGRTDQDLLPQEIVETVRAFDREVFAHGGPLWREERVGIGNQGEKIFLSQKLVYKESADHDYLIGFSTDITELRKASQQLAASEEHFRLLAENASDVVVLLSDTGNIRWVSPSLTPTLGWMPEEWISKNGADFLVGKDAVNCCQVHVKAIQEGKAPPIVKEQIRAKDGSIHWIETHASPYRNAQGDIDGAVASFRLIDAEVAAEEELRLSEERYRLLAENARDLIWTMETDGQISDVSPSVQPLLGLTPGEFIKRTRAQTHPSDSLELWGSYWESLHTAIHAGQEAKPFRAELQYLTADNSTIWTDVMALPILDSTGALQKVLGVSRDISERKRFEEELTSANHKLELLATTDGLTGIANRRHLELMIRDAIVRSDRYGDHLSLILCDIDHFKSINDVYGHQVGDQVLIEFSRRIQGHIRKSDLFGRWGGEEFLLMLPHSQRHGAKALAEALRKLISETPFDTVGTVTASFGVAQRRVDEVESDWFARVDQLLYASKTAGRNTVTCC